MVSSEPGLRETCVAAELLAARIALCKQAAAANPASLKARRMLCESWLAMDRPDLALELLRESDPCDPVALTTLAKVQFISRDFSAVLHTLETIGERQALEREHVLLRFEALARLRRNSEARAMLATVQELDPDNVSALKFSVGDALARGDYDTVLATCERALTNAAASTTALHFRPIAMALMRQDAQAAMEMGMDRFVAVEQLGVPDGFEDATDFHRKLAQEVRADPTLRDKPQGVATRNGRQTLSRCVASEPVMASLIAMIEAAVDRYVRDLSDADAHPFVRCRPTRASLRFWSVLYSDGGYQRPHFHSSGWLSGVYHASGATEGAAESGGALLLGECIQLQRASMTPPWGVRSVASRAGQLVLFPSFLPHATSAPHAGIERLSVAFDLEPDE